MKLSEKLRTTFALEPGKSIEYRKHVLVVSNEDLLRIIKDIEALEVEFESLQEDAFRYRSCSK